MSWKKSIKRNYIVGTVLIFISVLITISILWGNQTFSVKTLPQIIFHLKVPTEGSDTGVYIDWALWCLPITSVMTFTIVFCFFKIHKIFKKKEFFKNSIYRLIRKRFARIGVVFIVMSLVVTFVNYDVYGYVSNITKKTDIYDLYYVDPSSTNITFPNEKRNLIHIYLESMETTYASSVAGGAYEESYISELEELAQENINFSNTDTLGGGQTIDGTQWTIASMVAQSAGIPLLLSISDDSYEEESEFLPGSYSIGEILQEQGYNQELLKGSSANFGGTSNFYSQHGDYTIVDYDVLKEEGRIPEDYYEFWGVEDEKLFTFAKEDLLELAQDDAPFTMTIVTVDAHTPDGYLCNSCEETHDTQYENVISCQSKQVSEFIEWVQEQDFYENTTIIITGDHTSMKAEFFDDLDSEFIRTPYNVIINSAVTTDNSKNRTFTTMDWYPTILAALGAEIEGERLGLGTNLFSNVPTLAEEFGLEYLIEGLKKTSDYYNQCIIKSDDSTYYKTTF